MNKYHYFYWEWCKRQTQLYAQGFYILKNHSDGNLKPHTKDIIGYSVKVLTKFITNKEFRDKVLPVLEDTKLINFSDYFEFVNKTPLFNNGHFKTGQKFSELDKVYNINPSCNMLLEEMIDGDYPAFEKD